MTNSTDHGLSGMLPGLRFLRAARIAADPKKMLLGVLGLLVLILGEQTLSQLPFAPQGTSLRERAEEVIQLPRWLAHSLPQDPVREPLRWREAVGVVIAPLTSVIDPALGIFRNGNSWPELAWSWTRLIWALLVWSLFGGAICRMSAFQFARHERISPVKALRFARAHWQNLLVAPFLPMAGILCLLAGNALLGLLASLVPSIGVPLLAIVWGLVLFTGFLMALMLAGFGTGWPLMVAAVSTEDSDGFDGLSRSFGFLTDRPAYAALLVVLAIPVFAFGWSIVSLLTSLAIWLSHWAIEAGSAGPTIAALASESAFSMRVIDFWNSALLFLLLGYGPSFFWSATTVAYFLLRLSDDGTPLDQVANYDPPATASPVIEATPTASETVSQSAE